VAVSTAVRTESDRNGNEAVADAVSEAFARWLHHLGGVSFRPLYAERLAWMFSVAGAVQLAGTTASVLAASFVRRAAAAAAEVQLVHQPQPRPRLWPRRRSRRCAAGRQQQRAPAAGGRRGRGGRRRQRGCRRHVVGTRVSAAERREQRQRQIVDRLVPASPLSQPQVTYIRHGIQL